MPTIVMISIGNIHTDGRVQKEIGTLKKAGHKVTLIQWTYSGKRGDYEYLGFPVIDYEQSFHANPLINFWRQILFNFFAWRQLKILKPDYVQCNDLNTLGAGFLFRRQTKVIFDVRELLPESQSGLRRLLWSIVERALVKSCDHYIVPEINRLQYFAKKYALDTRRLTLLENFPVGQYHFTGRDYFREKFAIKQDQKILFYGGLLNPERDIESMLLALSLLSKQYVLVLLGALQKEYAAKLEEQVAALQLKDRVYFHKPIPHTSMLDYINASDIGLIFYQNNNLNNYYCASNKVYDFIYCGKFIITNDYPGLKKVVMEGNLGICVSELTGQAIASAVDQISTLPGLEKSNSSYIWENQEAEYLKVFV